MTVAAALCAESGSCAEQRSTEPEDRQSKWRGPWRGCQYSSPGGGVAGGGGRGEEEEREEGA